MFCILAVLLTDVNCEENDSLSRVRSRSRREVPASFTKWYDEGYTNSPEDQKSCGGCWSFPATGMLEAAYKKYTGELPRFSEQYLVDCTFEYSGCAGGSADDGLKRMRMRQFIPSDSTYTYKGYYSKKCLSDQTDGTYLDSDNAFTKLWLTSYAKVPAIESSVLEEIQNGPVAIGMYISKDFLSYASGVFDDVNCVTDALAHSMLLIGYTADYYLLKASYGTSWGDNGYIKLKRGSKAIQCNILKYVYSLTVTYRRELQYVLGTGKLKFYDAKKFCKAKNTDTVTGWTLAIIPTAKHNQEVLKLFTDKYGTDSKANDYNLFWIGLMDSNLDGTYKWIDNFTPYQYSNLTKTFEFLKFTRMSKLTGEWSSTGSQKKTHRFVCSRPKQCWDISTIITHATVTFSDTSRSEGSTASISCESGYVRSGSSTISCTGGVWDTLPTCSADSSSGCSPPTIAHGTLSPVTDSTYAPNAAVTVSCTVGYTLSSESDIITCNVNSFSNVPTCDVSQCSAPSISNSILSPSQSKYNHNTVVSVSCSSEYTISGSSTITCSQETWSTLPTCTATSDGGGNEATCSGGYYRDTSTQSCTKCPVGTWLAKSTEDKSECTSCSDGKTSLEGADREDNCFWPNCKCNTLPQKDGIYYYSCNCY